MQPKFRKFLETIFGAKICKFEQMLHAGNQQNHCKNNGFGWFFVFPCFVFGIRFCIDL